MQKKYLTFIFIATIFHQGWTLKCYECFGDSNCGDPFNPAYQLEKECTSSTACIKRQYTDVGGDIFADRFCYGDSPADMTCEEFLAVQDIPGFDVKCYQCDEDLCNGLNGYEGPLTTTLEETPTTTPEDITTTPEDVTTTPEDVTTTPKDGTTTPEDITTITEDISPTTTPENITTSTQAVTNSTSNSTLETTTPSSAPFIVHNHFIYLINLTLIVMLFSTR